jgi:hypothetical protein
MSHSNTGIQQSRPNVQFLIDRNGRQWFCEVGIDRHSPLGNQACTRAEDWIYDRSFGG